MAHEPAAPQLEVAREPPPREQAAEATMKRERSFGGASSERLHVLVPERVADLELRRRRALEERDARQEVFSGASGRDVPEPRVRREAEDAPVEGGAVLRRVPWLDHRDLVRRSDRPGARVHVDRRWGDGVE